MINAKKKGNAGENAFANWLFRQGFRAFKDGMSGGGFRKGDIQNDMDFSIEVKTVKALNLKEAWKQTNMDANLSNTRPLLAIHYDGMPKDEWMIVMNSADWIELIKQEQEPLPELERGNLRFLIPQGRDVLRRILKEMDK